MLDKTSTAGMLACPLPSCINKCVSTKVANNSVIRHFEQRLLQKPSTTAKLALPLLRLGNRTKFTMAMCHSQFVAVSRCSILTPAGLQVSSAKPDVPQREPASGCRKGIFKGALNLGSIFLSQYRFRTMIRFFSLCFLLGTTLAIAHPDIFMNAEANLVFNDMGFEGVQNHWAFDELYSKAMLESVDKDKDGKLNSEETKALQKIILPPILKFSYYNYLALGSKFVTPSQITNFSASFEQGKLILLFLTRFDIPASEDYTALLLAVTDPTNYILISADLNKSKINAPSNLDVEYFVDSLKGMTLFDGFSAQIQGIYIRFRKVQ